MFFFFYFFRNWLLKQITDKVFSFTQASNGEQNEPINADHEQLIEHGETPVATVKKEEKEEGDGSGEHEAPAHYSSQETVTAEELQMMKMPEKVDGEEEKDQSEPKSSKADNVIAEAGNPGHLSSNSNNDSNNHNSSCSAFKVSQQPAVSPIAEEENNSIINNNSFNDSAADDKRKSG